MDRVTELESLVALGIALNLAYLNLSSFRFTERLKHRLRAIVDRRGNDLVRVRDHPALEDDYAAIWVMADLETYKYDLPPPDKLQWTETIGNAKVQRFLELFCNNVTRGSIVAGDKFVTALCLAASGIYLFYIAALKLKFGYLGTAYCVTILLPGLYALYKLYEFNQRTYGKIFLALLIAATAYVLFYTNNIWNFRQWDWPLVLKLESETFFFLLVIVCVIVPVLLVIVSTFWYNTVERHFTERVTRIVKSIGH